MFGNKYQMVIMLEKFCIQAVLMYNINKKSATHKWKIAINEKREQKP